MHGAYLPPESPLNNNVNVFVYRVFGKWENIATYGDTSTASNEVFELALNSETGAILLTTSYQEASQVPSLKEASRKQIHIPAPFPTGVPED